MYDVSSSASGHRPVDGCADERSKNAKPFLISRENLSFSRNILLDGVALLL
jgi:hypothetical protein